MNLGNCFHLNELIGLNRMANLIHFFLKDDSYNGPYNVYLNAIASSTHICLSNIVMGIDEFQNRS